MRPIMLSILALLLAGALLGSLPAPAADVPEGAAYDAPVELSFDFRFHIDDDLSEQDVFFEKEPGDEAVYRVPVGVKNLRAPLFATAEPVAHNPFDLATDGPYAKGKALGVTLGEWLDAEGAARYRCSGGSGRLEADFTGLVPEGLYTVWHFFMAMPPTTPFIGTYDLPLGERDGSQSIFRADGEGNARLAVDFRPCLQLSGEHLASGLAVAWHSDGKTWGVEPGPFAQLTHIQLYTFLPSRAGL